MFLKRNFLCLNKNSFLKFFLCICMMMIFVISNDALNAGATEITRDSLRKAIDSSANYLVNQVKEDGMFEYRINMNTDVKVKRKYNILRHSGAIYALSMYYQLQPEAKKLLAIKLASQYLKDKSIFPVFADQSMLAVWSIPEVRGSLKYPLQVKLGGTGLGLVALLSVEKIHPGFTPLADLRNLGHFIRYMQKEDGGFYSKYIPSKGGRQDNWTSLYYPGEAALALLMLYEKDRSDIWLNSACKALEYLAKSREGLINVPADHWALLATEKALSFSESEEFPASKALLLDHGIKIAQSMMDLQIESPLWPNSSGGFSPEGRVTPSSTILEGLQAAFSFLPLDHSVAENIYSSVTEGISFLLRSQITEGEFLGAFPRAIGTKKSGDTNSKKFNQRATEVRIDYLQHAMCAMIQYLEIMQRREKSSLNLLE